MTRPALHAALLALADEAGGPLLGLDTSAPIASVATVGWVPGRVHEELLPAATRPSEALGATLARLAAETGAPLSRLAAIVVGIGPGSFTGLRVGLATAKGLALGHGAPLFAVSSLALLAAGYGPGRVAVALDARRGELFGAVYEVDADGGFVAVLEDAARPPDELARRLGAEPLVAIVGDAAATVVALGGLSVPRVEVNPGPRAALGILHAGGRILAGDADPWRTLVPRYLRVSEAERQAGTSSRGA